MNYSFLELQNKYKIVIPQIQRDYAQGRKDKDNDDKIISYDFIEKLIKVLTTETDPLNLDFVYGYTKEISKDHTAFIPLDGQQRLTTLWLLHWYLSPRKVFDEDAIMLLVSDETKKWLNNFTYETRNTSKRFCHELINKPLPSIGNIVELIRNANWFMASWENDPTVVSMLNMLETMDELSFDKEKAWENLFEKRKITFDYIDIKSDEFKLTDELYIKMNSRGKPLTSFENFKASFSEILSAKDTEFIDDRLDFEGSRITYQQYFAFKIDNIWTDLFWDFTLSKGKDISSCFMNFFTYIAQMCYFKDNKDKSVTDFKRDFSLFKKKENALFLFNTLDLFHEISIDKSNQVNVNNINIFFENIFQKDKIDDLYNGQIRLFDDKGINLFEKCLLEGNDFDNRYRIILFSLISYVLKYNLREVNNDVRYYVRVIRNLLQMTRQRNEIAYNTNVRINSFGKYWKLFNQLLEKDNVYERLLENIDNRETDISDDAVNNETEKAEIIVNNINSNPNVIEALFKIEEFIPFGGLIHNLSPEINFSNFIEWSGIIRDIWSCSDDMIVASLIASDFRGFYTKDCRLGEMWFFGKKTNWNTILAGKSKIDSSLSDPLILLLNKYNDNKSNNAKLPEDILEDIIQEFIDSLEKNNWQYYFCKYKKYFLRSSNYYSWNGDFENEILGNTGINPLLSYHINPYVLAVSNLLDDSICKLGECWSRYSEESCLRLENGFNLYSKQDGWLIIIPENQTISTDLRVKYNIEENNILHNPKETDRIEIAVQFCKDLVEMNKYKQVRLLTV